MLEFVSDYSSLKLFIGLFIFLLIPCLIYFIHKKITGSFIKPVIATLYTLLFISSGYTVFSRSEISMYNEISTFKLSQEYSNYKAEISLLNSLNNQKSALKVQERKSNGPETYVFVIGESTSKFHMQLYGYNRNTNPELMKLKQELFLFNNVKSSQVHTVESIKDMFLLTDVENSYTNNTLIDCFKNAGFSTYWLSNQSYLGKNETPVSAIAKNTTQQIYINTSNTNKLDEDLFPEFKKILNKKVSKKIVFIHLMGTHLSYQNRYPKNFNVFNEKNISIYGKHADSYINQYDNAILYNDYVVSEIIKTTKNVKGLAAVTYLSDHGDEVYDFRNFHGHSGAVQSKYMTSVPFFIWGNGTFNSAKKDILKNAKQNINEHFTLKNFSHTVQDLFKVKSNLYQEDKSFFKVKDSTSLAEVFTKSTNKNTIKEPYQFDSKIWVHRVNSLERLAEIEHLFKGMELDIVFENGKFDIRHPPAKSIHLSLEEFLSNIKQPKEHYFWLDLKNLNLKNINEVNQRLSYLTQKFNIKKNIVLETTNPKAISKLNTTNYYTSFYLPNLSGLNESELYKETITINNNLEENNPIAISQSFDNYYIMKEHFNTQNKLIWALNLNWNNPKTHTRIENLLKKDSTIRVCLVNYTTDNWR